MSGRTFPVMYSSDSDKAGPVTIPWSVAEKAYSRYAALCGGRQTLERVAERGGFYAGEMDELYPEWRNETSEIAALRARVDELEDEKRPQCGALLHPDCAAPSLRERIRAAESKLEKAEQENARLRKVIEDAPHHYTCQWMRGLGKCDCWKASALEAALSHKAGMK